MAVSGGHTCLCKCWDSQMAVSCLLLSLFTPNFCKALGSIVPNPIIYRPVPSPSRYEIWQCERMRTEIWRQDDAICSKNLTNWRQFLCVCPVIDHEFRHNIVKVAVDPQGDSRVDSQTTLTMLWRNSVSITSRLTWWCKGPQTNMLPVT